MVSKESAAIFLQCYHPFSYLYHKLLPRTQFHAFTQKKLVIYRIKNVVSLASKKKSFSRVCIRARAPYTDEIYTHKLENLPSLLKKKKL